MEETAPRPPEFDARLMKYYSNLKGLAHRLTNNGADREDLLNESIAYILTNWTSFRPDGGFYNWITLCMRHVAQNKRRREAVRSKHMPMTHNEDALLQCAVEPDQFAAVELSSTLAAMEGRGGGALLRRAMGDTLDEVGASLGVGRERARQITEKERERLRAAA